MSTEAAFAPALKLSPHFQHLDATAKIAGYQSAPRSVDGHNFQVLQTPIDKSPNDAREYRLIRLENGMEALLVSDPKTDKAAASLCVRVGHLSDPVELQGLAHFCEHLLFMGTDKYPRENEYSEFLSSNSGSSNAFTGLDETNYHFDVHPSALDGALDRFAQFFISPLFDASCTEREIQAVDSENKKNLQSDMWRMFQLEKSLSSKKHAYWRFGTGNMESLWTQPKKDGLDPREELLKFHNKYYSANLFKLAIIGSDSLDQLTEMVVSKFSRAENKNLPPPLFAGSPFEAEQLKQSTYVKTLKDTRLLELTFPFFDTDAHFTTKPGSFLSHYVGHEGPGSILSLLKQKGWANALGAGNSGSGTGSSLFKINIDLTKEGLEQHSDVAAVVFHYIALLQKTPPQEWAYKEISMLNEIAYRYQEPVPPMSYATVLSSFLQKPFPRSQILSAPVLVTEFDRDQLLGALSLLDVENCRVTVGSQAAVAGLEYNDKERWYGTNYTVKPFEQSFLEAAKTKTSEELALPQPNQFMPTNLDIIDKQEVAKPAPHPTLLEDKPQLRVWHKKDDRWWVPKATTYFMIKSPQVSSTAEQSVLSRLYTDLVEDSLQEFAYDADLAGLSYELYAQLGSIVLVVEGYNDKLSALQDVVVKKMTNFEVDPQRFELLKDKLRQGLENYRLANPYQHAIFHLTHFTLASLFEPEEQLQALLQVTPQDLTAHIKAVFDRTFVEALSHGNLVDEDSIRLASNTASQLRSGQLEPAEKERIRGLVLPEGSHCFRAPVQDPGQLNSAVDLLLFFGEETDPALRTRTSMLAQLASDHCFDVLRTKEQLGYIAQSSTKSGAGLLGFHVIVQSERDADYVDRRVENWFVELRAFIEGLSEEEFAQHRESVVNRKREDHKNMSQETGHLWSQISNGYYDFEKRSRDAEQIKTLSKTDILSFFDEFVAASAPRRSKLSIHIRSLRLNQDAMESLQQAITESGLTISAELEASLKENPTFDEAKNLVQEAFKDQAALQTVLQRLETIRWPQLPAGVTEVDKCWRQQLKEGPVAAPRQPLSDLSPRA